ncbi:MAG: glycosyl hydrolase [Bacteroidales bacterium]|nr:glycosyl hydrolase [Bacteroidales bacterium]MDY5261843.1 glycosyl hydrolase [Candidatus Cryptobacteroides sp.]MDY5569557.1 glycosyl hydrolase [Candidatus Cryptobacteroides sp.]
MKPTAILTTAMILAASCTHQEGRFDENTSALMARLQDNIDKGVMMYGHQDDLMYGHTWRVDQDEAEFLRSDVMEVCGKYPAVYGLDLGGIELGSEQNLDDNYFAAMRASAIAHHQRGGVVTFSWHPRNPLTEGDAWDVSSKEVVASILEGGSRHDLFIGWLGRVADYIESFKTSDGQMVPIIFRPWHEHTGSWFWWGRDLCSVEEYKALWKMTFDYLSGERGLRNLIWSYSPGAGGVTEEIYMERWPGDEMVDMIGIDCYQYSTSEVFIADLANALDIMKKISAEHGKMMAVTEAGYEGIPQADWWTGTLYEALKDYPLSYVLTWRNACDKPEHFYAPFPGHLSADDFKAFAAMPGVGMID